MTTFRIHYLNPEALIMGKVDVPAHNPNEARTIFRKNSTYKGFRITKVKKVRS